MMVQSSLSSCISPSRCFVYDHGKQQNLDVLPNWPNCGGFWHKSSMLDECCCDECKNPISAREEKENDVISDYSVFSKTYSNPSLIKDVSETFTLNSDDNVYKRRKQYDSNIDLSSLPIGCDGVLASIFLEKACKSDLEDKENALICRQRCPQDPSVLEMKIVDSRSLDIVSKTKSIKRVLPFMKDECDKIGECSSFDMRMMSTEKSWLEKKLSNSSRIRDSLGLSSVHEDVSCSQICNLCGVSDNTLKMLICDLCENAFHMLCCNPRVRTVPIDEWHCQSCKKRKPKPLSHIRLVFELVDNFKQTFQTGLVLFPRLLFLKFKLMIGNTPFLFCVNQSILTVLGLRKWTILSFDFLGGWSQVGAKT